MARRKSSPAPAKPAPAPEAKQPQGDAKRKGCLGRLLGPLAVLFGGCMLLSVIITAVQTTGEQVGLLPTATPLPTPIATEPLATSTATTIAATTAAAVAATDIPAPPAATVAAATSSSSPSPTATVLSPTHSPTLLAASTSTPTLGVQRAAALALASEAPTATPAATASANPTATPAERPTTPSTGTPTTTPTTAPIAAPTATTTLSLRTGPYSSVDANLRGGPGTQYKVVGGAAAGQSLEGSLAVIGQSADGQWLALANGAWVSASLVTGAPGGLAVVNAPAAGTAQAEPARAAAAVEVPAPAATEAPAATAATAGGQWPEYTCADNPSPPPNPACPIKGNITDERIYHMPGQRDYCKTRIDESEGERWFCSPEEAEAAGWRAAKR